MIKSIYSNAKAKIRTMYGESDFFPIEKGVLQGETLSPKLFTIFIEDIINILHKSKISPLKIGKADLHILLFADDIIILATNPIDLQKKMNVLKKFLEDNDLK